MVLLDVAFSLNSSFVDGARETFFLVMRGGGGGCKADFLNTRGKEDLEHSWVIENGMVNMSAHCKKINQCTDKQYWRQCYQHCIQYQIIIFIHRQFLIGSHDNLCLITKKIDSKALTAVSGVYCNVAMNFYEDIKSVVEVYQS